MPATPANAGTARALAEPLWVALALADVDDAPVALDSPEVVLSPEVDDAAAEEVVVAEPED